MCNAHDRVFKGVDGAADNRLQRADELPQRDDRVGTGVRQRGMPALTCDVNLKPSNRSVVRANAKSD